MTARNHPGGSERRSHGLALLLAAALGVAISLGASAARAQPAAGASQFGPPVPGADAAAMPRSGLGVAPADLDRSTPARAWRAFADAASARNFERAAWVLDLGDVAADQARLVGPTRAAKLWRVLRSARVADARDLPDEVDPSPQPGGIAGRWEVTRFRHGPSGTDVAVVLERSIAPDDGTLAWRISSDTVSSIAHWYARIVEGDLQAVTAEELNRGLGPRPPDLDLSTPARSLKSLVEATRAGRLDDAARSLWLNDIPEPQQPEVGRKLARELMIVLDQTLWIDFTAVSDRPFGKPESSDVADDEDEIGAVPLGSQKVPIRMVRVPEGREPALWVVSRATVTRIPALYAEYGIGELATWIPARLFAHRFLEVQAWQWIGLGIALVVALLVGAVARRAVLGLTGLVAARWPALARTPFAELIGAPMQAIFALVAVGWLGRWLRLSKPAVATFDDLFAPLTIGLVTWLVLRSSELVTISIERYLAAASAESSLQRSVSTRLQLVRRLFNVLVLLVATAAVLMRFEVVRHIGTGLLASAGFAGVVIGFAAQQTLGNLFTGLLFGITQPVRIGDIVVFEGEWGFVEEISLTHVVICTWDLRRLVVPIPYLLARPIQNWTRSSSEVLGTVTVKTSASVDVDALRAEAVRVVKASKLSDGKEPNVSVADFTDTSVEIRVVVGASNAAQLWALRSEVREALLRWVQSQRRVPPAS